MGSFVYENAYRVIYGEPEGMSEGEFVRKLKDEFNRRDGVKVMKLNTGPYGQRGEPDIIGCYRGWMFVLEVKLEYNKPTELQLRRLDEWRLAGAYADVITHYPGINIHNTVSAVLDNIMGLRGFSNEH